MKEEMTGKGDRRTKKVEGVDYKRAAVEYPQRVDAGHRHYLMTKPFYNLRVRHPKHRAFGLDVETQRYFCDFANIAVALDLEAGKRVLDVGCGSGWLSEYFARLGYDVTGIDIAPDLVEMSRERLERLPFQVDPETRLKYRFVVHDIEGAPLAETFDAVICYDSLHHFEDEEAVFRHLSAMTADGGLLFILEGSKPPEGSATEQELMSVMSEFGTLESPYSNEYLRALLRRNGFFIVGDYVSVDGLYHRDMLRDDGLLPVSPQPVNYLLAKKVTRGDAEGLPDSLRPGQLRARLTLVGEAPERLTAGAAFEATLRVENVGDTIWLTGPASRKGAVMVGIRVLDEAGSVVAEVHDEPPLRRALAPGESVTSQIAYPLGLPCGDYTLKIDMVNQQICWFEQRGSEPLTLPVRIVEPAKD
jgi:SAM-dependent methyltransferase